MPTVLVTGAGRGLGLEFVRQYAADGWDVIATARDPDQATALNELARQHSRIERQSLDLLDFKSIDALAKRLAARSIDVLLCSAGTMGRGDFAKEGLAFGRFGSSDFDDWANVFKVNAFAPMKLAEVFVEQVARSEQKKIVALTSIIGSITKNQIGGLYAYRASKTALNAIMHSLAIDLGRKYKILAAPIHPGWARTDMGGPRADIDAATSVAGVRRVIAELDPDRAGRYWMYDGSELPW